ncbi:MAG: M67 family metallopeptidase [Deltaproteobacteria bacterium]|nr:M67 family metallopeptidase [Deltaproteobacteria bacterium]
MVTLCQSTLDEIIRHSESKYPHEACGLLIGPKEQKTVTRFIACKNIYDTMHAKDPTTYPRTSKTAYLIDSLDYQKIAREAHESNEEIKSVVHSHTDHDAYFSDEDRLVAAPWGEPLFPGISYIVISIWNQKFKEANEYYWDDRVKDFVVNRLP